MAREKSGVGEVDRLRKKNNKKGVTLIELVLALALIAIILISLTSIFNISLKAWSASGKKTELVQNARIAMERMMSDLRYAVSISQFSDNVLEFDTRYLVNEDDSIETITYYKSGASLYRAVDNQSNAPAIAEYINTFDIILRDADGQSVASASEAASAEVALVLSNENYTFSIVSSAHMRSYNQ